MPLYGMIRRELDALLERSEYMPLEYFRKQKWTGSFQGMRFLLHRIAEEEQDFLEAVIWKEPYSYEATPEEEKLYQRFPFSEEGREQAIVWLEEEYEHRREEWRDAMKWDWDRKTVEKK